MVHDCLITPEHILVPILPLAADRARAERGGPFYAREPSLGARVAVIRRDEGVKSLRWFDVSAGYVFHTMNAFEDGGRIVADVKRFDRAPLFPDPGGGPAPASPARLTRWTFDLAEGSTAATEAPLDDLPGEFPRMDERFLGLHYRHGWFAGQIADPGSLWFDAVAHVDLDRGTRRQWNLPARDAVSEPVFVPAGRMRARVTGGSWP